MLLRKTDCALLLVEITHLLESRFGTEAIESEGILKASFLDVAADRLVVARCTFVNCSCIEERLHLRQQLWSMQVGDLAYQQPHLLTIHVM